MSTKLVTAEQEFAKNPDLKKEDIDELQRWAAEQGDLPDISTEKMVLFYHSCYWNMKNTKSCIRKYYDTRESTPEFFKLRDPSRPEMQKIIKTVYYSALPVKDPNGYQIISHGLQLFESNKYDFGVSCRLLSMVMDSCAFVEGTVPGYVFLFSMKGVGLMHLTRLSYSLLKKFFIYVQEGMPVRLKAIHVIDTLPLVDKILFIIKPFVKKELYEMLHIHYGGYEEIQKFIPKECLPKDFGGYLKSNEELHADFVEWAHKMSPVLLADEVYKKSATVGKVQHAAESIQSLDFD